MDFYYICIVPPTLRSSYGNGWAGCIYIKGVTERFDFDAVRISQVQTSCQKQSNGNALWDVYYAYSPWCILTKDARGSVIYKHQRGAFGVARFDNLGNARAFTAWNE